MWAALLVPIVVLYVAGAFGLGYGMQWMSERDDA
jgi:hypothetical protein